MTTLDKTRPYATIHNDEEGRAFEQDGIFFGPDGESIDQRPSRKAKPAAPVADDQVAQQLADGA